MKNITFTETGGFPLTQGTLDYMQDTYKDILKMIYSQLLVDPIGKFIIGGAQRIGNVTTEGWILIDGELFKLLAGTGTHIKISQNQTAVTFQDSNNKLVYTERYAEMTMTAAGNIPFEDFERLSQHKVITSADCTHLELRTYSCDLPKHTTTLELDPTGNTTGGFILNRINPFEGIPNGYQLLVKCGTGAGLTFLTKNSVESNLRFNEKEFAPGGDVILLPYFGTTNFIGAGAGGSGAGYAPGLHVLFSWSAALNVWIEISRTSNLSI